jgi:CSLREA domain-containing protein
MISKFPKTVFRLTLAAALIAALALTATPARAATITLTTNLDTFPGDHLCSLREAILAANTDTAVDACPAGNGADTLILPAGEYILSLAGINENAALTGDLDITEDLIITGAGSGATTINANLIDRLFHIISPSTVEISGVTITLGKADLGGGILNTGTLTLTDTAFNDNNATNGGGGIYNSGTATISTSAFSGNSADLGGGIYNTGGGTMTITNSTVSGNTVTDDGGGIVNEHTLTLTDSTVSGNVALFGGGIYNASNVDSGTLTVTNSTLSGNSTTGDGGGVFNSETAIFINSTLSGNNANGDGGGIYNIGTAKLHNVTIATNAADSDADGLGDGGGVFVSATGTLNLGNSLIAKNFDKSAVIQQPDCSGMLTSLGYNLIQKVNGCTLAGLKGNLFTMLPLLGPLQDNGGATWTHALLAGSPAIDAGNPAGCKDGKGTLLTTDQRGYARPVNGDGNKTIVCDMGAFEY